MATFYGFLVGLAIVFLACSPSSSAVHFVLIHGSGHGAWCWYKLATLLEQAGHKVAAVDLAYSGRNQVPLEFVHTFDEYHKPLFKYLESLSPKDKVVLVGHSYGGYGVSSGLERFPEKVLGGVFASAFMVGPNFTLEDTNKFLPRPDQVDDSFVIGDPIRIVLFGPHFAATMLYQNSPPEDLKLANYSIRLTQIFRGDLANRQIRVTKERFGTVPRAYVAGLEDKIITPDVQRAMIKSTPPQVVREIEGADHMIMFSKPQEFANNLIEIAESFELFGLGGRPHGYAF
ncbi:salicylic acid-binding protein 2-like [Coffea eugenioides]|uniref:salicylic acid-binding protein 2-like n=1 Tax=Coffea eugenioides TaxID=49369 RepID=UPI000F60AE38|nr:salicylic acid-binding protein 2-like [Coffea eugenioides]